MCKRRKGQQNAGCDNNQSASGQRYTRPVAPGAACGTDYEYDQSLRRQRFNEPAGVKEGFVGVENLQQNKKGEEVVDRTNRPDQKHEVANYADIPAVRPARISQINVVSRNRHLRQIIQKVIE